MSSLHHFRSATEEQQVYDELYGLYRRLYFNFGGPDGSDHFGDVLPRLMRIARPEVAREAETGSELVRW